MTAAVRRIASSDYYCFFLQGCHLHLNCKVKKQWWGLHFTLSAFGPDCRPTFYLHKCKLVQSTQHTLPSATKFDYSKKKTLLLCFWRHSLGLPVTFQSNAKANNSGWLFHSGGATHNLCIYPGHSATLPIKSLSHVAIWHVTMLMKKVQCIAVCLENDVNIRPEEQ